MVLSAKPLYSQLLLLTVIIVACILCNDFSVLYNITPMLNSFSQYIMSLLQFSVVLVNKMSYLSIQCNINNFIVIFPDKMRKHSV